jgi:hypothetical protein
MNTQTRDTSRLPALVENWWVTPDWAGEMQCECIVAAIWHPT